MLLCLDVGNSHIYGGIFSETKLILKFRHPSNMQCTADQLGIFLRNILREYNINYHEIKQITIGSVVPELDYTLHATSIKYFSLEPYFLLPTAHHGLTMKCAGANELGADRLATSIAAANLLPQQNLIIVDLGTATTVDVISKNKEYKGGLIMAGLHLQIKSLTDNTAKLPPVKIMRPHNIIGETTIDHIQSGLYYGHLGALHAIINAIIHQEFSCENPTVIGTGGLAQLFEDEKIFNVTIPDLVLQGLRFASDALIAD